MKVAIGNDHGGIALKDAILAVLAEQGCEVLDHGCASPESVDYPDFGALVCESILQGRAERGILICGTGIGMSMVANRHKGIRAALCQESFSARMSRQHNDANVLCLGARVIGPGLARDIVQTWLQTSFEGGRHLKRISSF